MTYLELYEKATKLIDNGKITIGEYEEMIKPLKREICEWIPCSERLPLIEYQDVLATTTWGDITIASRCSCDDWFIHEGNSNAKTSDIIAWKLLPDPYIEDGEA